MTDGLYGRRIFIAAGAALALCTAGVSATAHDGWSADPCLSLRAAGPDRHVYVLYDASLSYRHDPYLDQSDDRARNLALVKRIGAHILFEGRFSFLPTTGSLSYSCWEYERGNDQATELEIRFGRIQEDTVRGRESWLGFLQDKLDELDRRVAIANHEVPRPSLTNHTDLLGALHRASNGFTKYPAREKYLIVFSDLDNDVPEGNRRFCEPLDLSGVVVIVENFGEVPNDGIEFTTRDPDRRLRWIEVKALSAGATMVCYDWDGTLLKETGLE